MGRGGDGKEARLAGGHENSVRYQKSPGPAPHAEMNAAPTNGNANTNGASQQSDLQRVQRKWQMASCAHFFEAFGNVLPLRELAPDTAEDLTPSILERAIAEPDLDTGALLMLRDIIVCLLVALSAVSKKKAATSWFQSLRTLVSQRSVEFADCYVGSECLLSGFDNGLDFLVSVGWNVRLGMLLALCDMAVEEADSIREAIRESEQACTLSRSEIEHRGIRLAPIGRCSRKRYQYIVGKTRIYSGYKRKGSGGVLVECSDAKSMAELAEALEGSGLPKDMVLASKIRDVYLSPLLELEAKRARKIERQRQTEILKEESRRRNAVRPRRAKAAYL